MDDSDLRCLEIEQNYNDICKILRRFIDTNLQTFSFDDFNRGGKKAALMKVIFKLLESKEAESCHVLCLDCLRILSRDKGGLGEQIDERNIATLLTLAELTPAMTSQPVGIVNAEVVLATVKPLCNLVYNSPVCAALVAQSHAAEGILTRLRMYWDFDIPAAIKLFDMKFLFLITALTPETCPKLKDEYHSVTYLTEALDLVLKNGKIVDGNTHRVRLEDSETDLCCEILKVLFNMMARRQGYGEEDTEEETFWLRLTAILHDLLLVEGNVVKLEDLRSNSVNLLTSVPVGYYSELVPAATADLPRSLESEGRSMEAVHVLLLFLKSHLMPSKGAGDKVKSKLREELMSPILTVLLQLARKQRPARKYLKAAILPPLSDVNTRPEEENTLRGHLCRLLTSPSSIIKDLVADFLFILCKHNVSRMVKYTGYGNAAGMFASKGLLMGGKSHSSSSSYSSDSDSETEEYAKYAHQINPVVGCLEPSRPDPTAGMTEEEKEYHVMELVNLMDKAIGSGVITPCRVGEDGKPHPVEHVLQLQPASAAENRHSDGE